VAEETADWTEADYLAFRGEYDRRVKQSGRYPHLARILDEDIDPDAPGTRDARFEFGLDCVLDGIAARLPS